MDYYLVVILFILITLSGVLAAIEIAFFSLSEAQIEVMVSKKKPGANLVRNLKADPEKLLTTILIANNIVNIVFTALFTATAIRLFGEDFLIIATILITVIILLIGEILPKAIGKTYSDKVSLSLGYPLFILQIILTPITKAFEVTTKVITAPFKRAKTHSVSDDEIKAMANIGVREGSLQENENILIKNVLRFNDIEVGQIMTPRVKMVCLNEEAKISEAIGQIREHQFSRLPIYKNNDDNITGILYVKDIINLQESEYSEKKLKELANKPLFTVENRRIENLLAEFKASRVHIAIVLDEHGGTAGMITLEDIVEEIVGEIDDETDDEPILIRKINQNTILANAETEIKMILNYFKIEEEFDTKILNESLNAYLLSKSANIPKLGEKFNDLNLTFTIEEATEKMIKKVRVEKSELTEIN